MQLKVPTCKLNQTQIHQHRLHGKSAGRHTTIAAPHGGAHREPLTKRQRKVYMPVFN